jgi:hypothetical protein
VIDIVLMERCLWETGIDEAVSSDEEDEEYPSTVLPTFESALL